MIGFVIGKMDFEKVEFGVDGVDQADIFGELVEEGNAAEAQTAGACRNIVTKSTRAAQDGPGAIGEFSFVDAALDGALACSESAVATALVPVAFDMMFLATVLHFVLASGAFVA